jgi:hypothetical protein
VFVHFAVNGVSAVAAVLLKAWYVKLMVPGACGMLHCGTRVIETGALAVVVAGGLP